MLEDKSRWQDEMAASALHCSECSPSAYEQPLLLQPSLQEVNSFACLLQRALTSAEEVGCTLHQPLHRAHCTLPQHSM